MTFSINPTANKTQAMFQQMAVAQNGTGSTAVIAGGSATVAPAASARPPPASIVASAAAAGSTGMTSGMGTFSSGGACECSCLCSVGAFPDAAVQGIGGFGGMSG